MFALNVMFSSLAKLTRAWRLREVYSPDVCFFRKSLRPLLASELISTAIDGQEEKIRHTEDHVQQDLKTTTLLRAPTQLEIGSILQPRATTLVISHVCDIVVLRCACKAGGFELGREETAPEVEIVAVEGVADCAIHLAEAHDLRVALKIARDLEDQLKG
jgi:hypothetical protein